MKLNKMITKEDIERKLKIIHKQIKHCGYERYYLEPLLEEGKNSFLIILNYILKQLDK